MREAVSYNTRMAPFALRAGLSAIALRRCSRSAAAPRWTPSPRSSRIDVVTGWFDDGIIEGGKNKLVPSVSMKLRNKTDQPLQLDPDQRDLPPRRRAGDVGRVFRLGDPAHRSRWPPAPRPTRW